MNYLMDTCVLSEFTRWAPEEKIIEWVKSIDEDMLFVSTITIGEIKNGIESLPDSNRKNDLLVWLNDGVITTLSNGQTLPRNYYQRSAAAGYTPLPIDLSARNSPRRA